MYNNTLERHIASVFTFGHGSGTVAAGATRLLAGFDGASVTTDIYKVVIPRAGWLKNLSMKALSTSSLNGVGHSVEVLINGAPTPTPMIVTWNSPGAGVPPYAAPNTITAAVAPGDVVSVRLKTNGTLGTLSRPTVSLEYEIEVDVNYKNQWNLDSATSRLTYLGGNVGIGTITPTEALEVNGNINIPVSGILKMGGQSVINQNGSNNFFVGPNSGNAITSGICNTSNGKNSLLLNSTGHHNTAFGFMALEQNTSGQSNVAVGKLTLNLNQTGNFNTALGTSALVGNTVSDNTAIGGEALLNCQMGNSNTAIGRLALSQNNLGSGNTAIGTVSGNQNQTGNNNTLLGCRADVNTDGLSNATAIGYNAKVGTSNSLVLGDLNVNVGIGTATPQEKLDIRGGSIKIKDGTEGAGKVLTSDPSGKGSWADLPVGFAPLGSIIAWHKNPTNSIVLTLPAGWIECNGGVLNDPTSPLDQMNIPDLNGAIDHKKKFLKGDLTSGLYEDDAMQSHKHEEPGHAHLISLQGNGQPGSYGTYASAGYNPVHQQSTSNYVQVQLGDPVDSGTGAGPVRIANETRPKNMSVVWIMRIK